MNTNLIILDTFDQQENIYDLIMERAKRAHVIMSGGAPSVEAGTTSIPEIAMMELLHKDDPQQPQPPAPESAPQEEPLPEQKTTE